MRSPKQLGVQHKASCKFCRLLTFILGKMVGQGVFGFLSEGITWYNLTFNVDILAATWRVDYANVWKDWSRRATKWKWVQSRWEVVARIRLGAGQVVWRGQTLDLFLKIELAGYWLSVYGEWILREKVKDDTKVFFYWIMTNVKHMENIKTMIMDTCISVT